MNLKSILSTLSISGICLFTNAQIPDARNPSQIIIEARISPVPDKDSIAIETVASDFISNRPDWKIMKQKVKDGYVKWTMQAYQPQLITSALSPLNYKVFEPGDSLHVEMKSAEPVYSGKGSVKFIVLDQIYKMFNSLSKPKNPKYYSIQSLDDFFEWNQHLNQQLNIAESLLNSNKQYLSSYAYEHLKARIISEIEDRRLFKFTLLYRQAANYGVDSKSLCAIFDSTANNKHALWLHKLPTKLCDVFYYYAYIRTVHYREYNFDLKHDSVNNETRRKLSYYNLGKKYYRGETLENYLAYLVTESGIKELGFNPEMEHLLNDYYSRPGFEKYREYVKMYELRKREEKTETGKTAPDFQLNDFYGQLVSKDSLKGKIVTMIFHSASGPIDTGLQQMLASRFNSFRDIAFVNVYTSGSQARTNNNSTTENTSGLFMNLHTGNEGNKHSILQAYNFKDGPSIYIWDTYGNFITKPLNGNVKDIDKTIIKLIERQLTKSNDGPYVLYEKDKTMIYTIKGSSHFVSDPVRPKHKAIPVQTDKFNTNFNFALKEKISVPPSEYLRPNKLFCLSDIEGNFDALRKLLQVNNVIDEQFNWTFGKGHLVFAGDMFDRGDQVTECLWLIYSLEEKAMEAGGYVHFILGNHDIMNLSGDTRYVHEKYKNNAVKIGKRYHELFNENSEMGRWLRSKNIIEKIGDLLFMHGGFSREMVALNLTVKEINDLARPYYANDNAAQNSNDAKISTIYGGRTSPFWYRSYYDNEPGRKASASLIDSTLNLFKVNHIITGHTIVANSVSIHYNGKVINTDTHHANGISEALLIEENKFYRVNLAGMRELLNSQANISSRQISQ